MEQVAVEPVCAGSCFFSTCELLGIEGASCRVPVEGTPLFRCGECAWGKSCKLKPELCWSPDRRLAFSHSEDLCLYLVSVMMVIEHCSKLQGIRINPIQSLPSHQSLPLLIWFSSTLAARYLACISREVVCVTWPSFAQHCSLPRELQFLCPIQ